MEQVKVKELASEFALKNSVVITELKKIGVWVPSPDTQVDLDIANRIRKRLQVMVEAEQVDKEKKEEKPRKVAASRARRSIKELGRPRKRAARKRTQREEQPVESPLLSTSMKPRKGRKSVYRREEIPIEEELPQKTEVTIEDEPVIERVEAKISAELIKQQLKPSAEELAALAASIRKAERAAAEAAAEQARQALAQEALPAEPDLEAQEAAAEVEAEIEPVTEAQTPEEAEKVPAIPEEEVIPVGPREVTFSEKVTLKLLAEKIGVKSNEVIALLFKQGIMAGINQLLDEPVVEAICEQFEVIPSFVTFEEEAAQEEQIEEAPEDLVTRAPVVTVMGHVDHGKTTLLDTIRKSRVAAGEAGGITQHIGAYHAQVGNRKIVFIDTPGHEAFTRIRARGAQSTDIVVLVVAADDGVMPQTLEAIDHARAADVPIIVAVNKIDRADAQPDRVKQGLGERNLVPEEWGGDTIFVEVSATEGTNLDSLLEMILLVADVQELKANPNRAASGVVLEARLEKNRGMLATLLIQNGTLNVGDNFIVGNAYGRIRAMFDDRGKTVRKAGPSSAVEVLGLQGLPEAGDAFQVVEDASKAREMVEFRQAKKREDALAGTAKISLDDLYAQMARGEIKELPVVIKADAQGSVEVLQDTLEKLSTEKVQIRILHKGVGAITESDVLLASTSTAIVIGFNVRPEPGAKAAAEQEDVDIRLYNVIYHLSSEIQQAMLGLLEPTFREKSLGRAEVRDTFRVPKQGVIAGSYVQEGSIVRNGEVRLLRDNVVIYEGRIDSLRRFKDDVNEVKSGYECGISIANFNDIKIGDVLEVFEKEEVAPELT